MASPSDSTLPMNTILHLITIRLSSTNYLLWVNQMIPLLSYQQLLSHVDGSLEAPPKQVLVEGKPTPNPEFSEWLAVDQRAIILLQASLTEEAFSEVVGLSSAHAIWKALEAAYGNSSMERVQTLRDQLRILNKSGSTVSEFGRRFKTTCDQLAAIGHPVEETDKIHWFLRVSAAPLRVSLLPFAPLAPVRLSGISLRMPRRTKYSSSRSMALPRRLLPSLL